MACVGDVFWSFECEEMSAGTQMVVCPGEEPGERGYGSRQEYIAI